MDSSARLDSVLDTAADGIVVTDKVGKILLFNKACEKIFGYTRDEAVGQNVSILMGAKDAAAHHQYMQRYLDTGERRIIGIGREVNGQHKDGTPIPLDLSVGEAKTEDDHQFIGIVRDLRSKKEIEARLSELQANLVKMTRVNALDEMGAAIAHEVNQPLTAIMLYLQTASRRARTSDSPDPQLIKLMEKTVVEAERASKIIQRMRNFVEKQDLRRQDETLATVIDECIELVSVGIDVEDVEITSTFKDYTYKANIDGVQVQQILVNLMRNAAQAVANSTVKRVLVDVEVTQDNLFIRVSDTGPGLSQEAIDGLFKAFSGTKRRGLGVGLAISRSIAQNHGGDLFVEPKEEGKGATFVLRLPSK
ncbi:two-component system sensor histidine kinase NtrB [Pseudovibrio exalbescens]|uniref:Sensor protein FixL n=1 Tax=Pseudovibrio exalbescens TaxID=197461 RepID=A0A1U7JD34_9HYPH|nr:PAS domain S-box protein [Pseudovibrio exalbescens]OKL42649.1 PAS domain-containing sensor histidine kinase [Pseudovibrio exalbescens]